MNVGAACLYLPRCPDMSVASFRPYYEGTCYVRISEITDGILVRSGNRFRVFNRNLFTFITRLIIFVYCECAVMLFHSTVLLSGRHFRLCIFIIRKCRTIGIIVPPTPSVSPLIRGSKLFAMASF